MNKLDIPRPACLWNWIAGDLIYWDKKSLEEKQTWE